MCFMTKELARHERKEQDAEREYWRRLLELLEDGEDSPEWESELSRYDKDFIQGNGSGESSLFAQLQEIIDDETGFTSGRKYEY